ncbi:uncharacterized protein LACBIDRAFT_299726 [Laccaria bicolor S238N-H82]|uniref:Predicted protein n=1 Tax=Laccaria bicolor (strain S238N-H82 / ATCC MYA-4686) TaxID=486041 RepID=B0DFA4_LACBS|nr:uncharacterized protein LACBIDRAFT_299726 [Laccaria bicolor S238N-H82]EDR06825.1 predicted protein [Laccaria bicolor S238N-H82]|eukprot:XP_001882672.1 predicted protein [Laccaria bicolor S238N-H82]
MAPRARTKASAAAANIASAASKVSPSAVKPKPPRASKKARVAAASLATLQKTRNVQVKEVTSVKNTSNAYDGHFDRGIRFLATLIEERRNNSEDICSEGIPTDELEKAFTNPPNRYSAMAVEMFLVQKCFVQGLRKDTAYGIQGAFAKYWDTMNGDKYAGDYRLDDKTGEVTGCPARAPAVMAVIHAVKVRAVEKGHAASRNHAEAITVEEMKKIIDWSEKMCPDDLLTLPVKDIETLMFRAEHALMRAFISSAFTLWTRCFELLTLQEQDIKEDCVGPAPYYIPHFKIVLENRKGWQHAKGYEGPRTGNIYDIYHQDVHAIDMSTHLPKWRAYLQKLQPNHKVEGNDYIFPYIAPNGLIHPKRDMSYDMLQGLLTKFAAAAGLKKHYTTHCFRRGGAQYRFMYAPIGMRWPLSWIRWWGGWAIGEHVDTLMKYLMDSLQSFEAGHGNALHPIPLGADQSFMGDHIAVAPVSSLEVREFKAGIDHKIDELVKVITATLSHTCHSDMVSHTLETTLNPSNTSVGPTRVSHTQSRVISRAASAPYILPESPPEAIVIEASRGMSPASSERGTSSEGGTVIMPSFRRFTFAIPDLGRVPGAWRRVIKQWEEIDPVTKCALKDWPKDWYEGSSATASKRNQRKTIFDEFVRKKKKYM